MIVDDDRDQLYFTRKMLEKAHIADPLIEMTGGRQALEYLERAASHDAGAECRMPWLIFLDLRMPDVDGFTLLRWIRGDHAFDKVHVIILSSSEDPRDMELCSALGAQACFVKHPNPASIACVLRLAYPSTCEAEAPIGMDSAR